MQEIKGKLLYYSYNEEDVLFCYPPNEKWFLEVYPSSLELWENSDPAEFIERFAPEDFEKAISKAEGIFGDLPARFGN
jgi:hypothetical protein